jgi:hypothetical protein
MAFKEVNPQLEIKGFFIANNNNVLTGYVRKFIPSDKFKDGGWFIVETTENCKAQTTDPKNKAKQIPIEVKAGGAVGLQHCATLAPLKDALNKLVRVTFKGTTKSKKFAGKDVKLFKVEIDDGEAF